LLVLGAVNQCRGGPTAFGSAAWARVAAIRHAFDLVVAGKPAGQPDGRQPLEQCVIPDHLGDQFLRAALAGHVGNQVGRLLAIERKLNRTKRSISDRLLCVNRQPPAAAAVARRWQRREQREGFGHVP